MLVIRKAKVKEVSIVVSFAVELLKYHAKFDPCYEPAKDSANVYLKYLRKCVFSSRKRLFVADVDGNLVGYALGEVVYRPGIFRMKRIGFISDMFVVAKYRKMGIGKRFLDDLLRWFKLQKLTFVELQVHAKNEVGNKAWNKFGFQKYSYKERLELH